MTLEDFVTNFVEFAELEGEFKSTTILKESEEWDSMTAMMMIGFCSEHFGRTLTGNELEELITLGDIYERITQ